MFLFVVWFIQSVQIWHISKDSTYTHTQAFTYRKCFPITPRYILSAGVHLRKSPRGGKSTSEDILGGRAYSEQYSILKS